jgi:hypothetical protein
MKPICFQANTALYFGRIINLPYPKNGVGIKNRDYYAMGVQTHFTALSTKPNLYPHVFRVHKHIATHEYDHASHI